MLSSLFSIEYHTQEAQEGVTHIDADIYRALTIIQSSKHPYHLYLTDTA